MKAAIRRKYCLPNHIALKEIDQPVPAADEVLIKVHATTVNRTDCANLTARPFIMRFVLGLRRPRQPILGTDFAGEVLQTGNNITTFQPGDRVFGFTDTGAGSQAEYMTAKANDVFIIPRDIDYATAAASLEGAHYAYTFLHKVTLKPGQRVLINGATGAIGSALLQLLRQHQVHITATCNTHNLDRIRKLGADEVIDYTTTSFIDLDKKYDYIFDAVGKSTFGQCKPLLSKYGVYISSELGPFAQNLFYPIGNAFFSKRVIFPIPYAKTVTIPYIIKQLSAGRFTPIIDRIYPLSAIREAYTYVMTGTKTGNVVLDLSHDR